MPRLRRTGLALVAALAAFLALPAAASAHAVSGIDYRFPLPVWLFALAAGVAVLASAPAAAYAIREGKTRVTGDVYPAIRPLHLGALGLALTTLGLVVVVLGGLFGPEDFFENPATIVVWVDFWVGLGIVTALAGNVWDFVSPLSAAGRALERALAFRGAGAIRYPERLGLWPATALVLLWSWLELVWDPAKEPLTLTEVAHQTLLSRTPRGDRIPEGASDLGDRHVARERGGLRSVHQRVSVRARRRASAPIGRASFAAGAAWAIRVRAGARLALRVRASASFSSSTATTAAR